MGCKRPHNRFAIKGLMSPGVMRGMRIEEDGNFVVINGHPVEGFVGDDTCDRCGEHHVYADDFDSFFCPGCNRWTESHPVCTDPTCPYCTKKRPERPLPVEGDEIDKNS